MTISKLTVEETAYYQKFYSRHKVIGLMYDGKDAHIILKMRRGQKGYTPYMCARDCGDHYIIARYGRYDRVDKHTLSVTECVDDK